MHCIGTETLDHVLLHAESPYDHHISMSYGYPGTGGAFTNEEFTVNAYSLQLTSWGFDTWLLRRSIGGTMSDFDGNPLGNQGFVWNLGRSSCIERGTTGMVTGLILLR